jgi:hypothetical protein
VTNSRFALEAACSRDESELAGCLATPKGGSIARGNFARTSKGSFLRDTEDTEREEGCGIGDGCARYTRTLQIVFTRTCEDNHFCPSSEKSRQVIVFWWVRLISASERNFADFGKNSTILGVNLKTHLLFSLFLSQPPSHPSERTTNRGGGSTPTQAVAARWPEQWPQRSSSIQPRADTSRKLSARRPRRGT